MAKTDALFEIGDYKSVKDSQNSHHKMCWLYLTNFFSSNFCWFQK